MSNGVFDLLVKGGRLIDPAQDIDGVRDVAIANGKVVAVEPSLPAQQAKRVLDASGKVVTPGWVDLHVHVYWGVSHYGIEPDATCLGRGVTTAVDLGSAGANTFPAFRRFIMERARTRLYAFLNISSAGMISEAVGENEELRFLNPELAVRVVNANRDLLMGIKVRVSRSYVGSSGLEPLSRARQAADAVRLPLAVHPNDPDGTLGDILSSLNAGDILTHCFHGRAQGILDAEGKVRPEVWDAVQRGVLFDVGHGRGSFSFPVVERALEQGLVPYSISSDLHTYSLYGPVFDQATTLSKFLYLGLSLPEVVRLTTTNPARAIGKGDTLGTLKPGAEGDVTICELVEGRVHLEDCEGNTRVGRQRIVPLTAVRNGRVYRAGRVRSSI
ncbi:MAG: amidohydrolase/deacetylase family metallohydrolase [Bacteroidetes bacterium]|nr:amidohydrolase/deacetylase family metallohydrolase [Bacteroidota bacterium]MCL5025162.1 amidohydrolase/deacetylase family metallohydrolase [Chloroflexota bacterium]